MTYQSSNAPTWHPTVTKYQREPLALKLVRRLLADPPLVLTLRPSATPELSELVLSAI
jgi:hypothetical protein